MASPAHGGGRPHFQEELHALEVSVLGAIDLLLEQLDRTFEARHAELAEDLVRQDREINRLQRELFRLAIEIGDDADAREWAMTTVLMARALERIGDNAVDIGEQVAFVVTGLFREFADSSHPAANGPDSAPVPRARGPDGR